MMTAAEVTATTWPAAEMGAAVVAGVAKYRSCPRPAPVLDVRATLHQTLRFCTTGFRFARALVAFHSWIPYS